MRDKIWIPNLIFHNTDKNYQVKNDEFSTLTVERLGKLMSFQEMSNVRIYNTGLPYYLWVWAFVRRAIFTRNIAIKRYCDKMTNFFVKILPLLF
jgi:hypothetical protein